ncbi:DgyrCDS8217 [Dimorphilus gyrociliatus]|uniref:DgyrCDS8217 n=1 Tax=Dimorphilus gyrociliatus TaxID=2664684 RepID=A0A7I8VVW1_9ANNE|nr:DgyrCDS8217 [Dimorphilus gyrociliatus]
MNSWADYLCKMCKCVSVDPDEVDSNPRRKHRMTESPTFVDLPPTKSFSPINPPVLPPENSADSLDEDNKLVYDVIWPAPTTAQPINIPPRGGLERQDSVPTEPAPLPPVKMSPVTPEQNYENIIPPHDSVNIGDCNHNTASMRNRCVPPPPPTKMGPNGYYNQVLDDQHYDFPTMHTHIPPATIGLQQVHAYENGSMGLVPPKMPKEPSSGILSCQVPKEPVDQKLKYAELSISSEDKNDFRPKAFRDLPLRNSNTKSFKRERTEEERIRLPRRKPTEEFSDEEDSIDDQDNLNDEAFSNRTKPKTPTSPSSLSNKGIFVPPNHSAANVRVPVSIQSHKMINYSELSLELPSTPSSPKKPVPATEYREIDFEKTTALRSVITNKPTQQSE